MQSHSSHIVRASTPMSWRESFLPPVLGRYDFSDHHPVEWTVDGLKGVSYNLQLLPSILLHTKGKALKDIERLVPIIVDWLTRDGACYDVICLQEIYDTLAQQLIKKGLSEKGYESSKRLGGDLLGNPTSGGVRVYVQAQWLMKDLGGHIFSHSVDIARGMDAWVSKGLKHVTLNKRGQQYHVINVHTQSSYDDRSRENFVEVTLAQISALKKYIDRKKEKGVILPNHRLIVCGDFNIPQHGVRDGVDTVSLRGAPLYARAKLLLGPGTTPIEANMATSGALKLSYDPRNNSYLNHTKERIAANYDLVFSVDTARLLSDTPFFDGFLHNMQRELSLLVHECTQWHNSKMSEESILLIRHASIALDYFIVFGKNKQARVQEGMLAPLFDVIDSRRREKQLSLKLEFMCALVERLMPRTPMCQQVNDVIKNYMQESLKKRNLTRMQQWLDFQIIVLAHASPSVISPVIIDRWMGRVEQKCVIDIHLEKLSQKIQHWERNGRKKVTAIDGLFINIQKVMDRYFSPLGNDKAELREACEKAIHEFVNIKSIAEVPVLECLLPCHHDLLFIANFLVTFGKALGFESWVQQGKGIYSRKTIEPLTEMDTFNQGSAPRPLIVSAL